MADMFEARNKILAGIESVEAKRASALASKDKFAVGSYEGLLNILHEYLRDCEHFIEVNESFSGIMGDIRSVYQH